MKKFAIILVLMVIFASVFSGCGKSVKPSMTETKKVIDMAGRSVEVPENVNRIVCSGPGALRLIVYMKAEDKVVGIEQSEKKWGPGGRPYILAHPNLLNLPVSGPGGPGAIGNGPDAELVTKIHPDVIFATYMEKEKADEYQAKVNIPVVVLSYGKRATFYTDEIFKSLDIIGKVLNKGKRAKDVTIFIKNTLDDLNKRANAATQTDKPTVYVGGISSKGMHGIDSTISGYPPFQAVSAKNVADSLGKESMHFFINKEQLVKWDPDYIFIDEGGYNLCKKDFQNPALQSLNAVKNANLYGLLPYNFYTTNIGTALADAYYIGKVLYPEEFKDINPEEKADEIYTFLVGKPVYKEMKGEFGGFKKLNFGKN